MCAPLALHAASSLWKGGVRKVLSWKQESRRAQTGVVVIQAGLCTRPRLSWVVGSWPGKGTDLRLALPT